MEARDTRARFGRGFRAMVPLWLGVVPFGLAYAVTARNAGLSVLETQALSLLVFAGSAQVSAAGLFGREYPASRSCSRRFCSTCVTSCTGSRSGASCR